MVIQCPKDQNIFEKVNELYETGLFTYATPDFLIFNTLNTNDPNFNDQWSLRNTGQISGQGINCDAKAIQAHEVTMGNPNIRVAVVDVGVDLTHPDLVNNLLPGFDVVNNTNNGAPQHSNDIHGTNCAGLIAAQANNGIGITGVAPNCRIIPISCHINDQVATLNQIATGIRWAAENGQADIISNSWGSGPLQGTNAAVEQEITWAINNGRDGLGCVVVFSTGNSTHSFVSWPAKLSDVIAVGATTHEDEKTSYSQYGTELDIVAPGGNHNIYTTTIQGQGNVSADYMSDFSGTSAAAPIVAGVAALVLSVNPCLHWHEVKRILELTADKPQYTDYCISSSHSNGTWNEKLGHGRVNALRAVKLAMNYNVHEANGSSNSLITTFNTWVLGGGCYTPGTYLDVEQHRVDATITIPSNSASGSFFVSSNGAFSGNPNSGGNYATVSGISGNQVTVSTYAYFIQKNIIGQTINVWFPAHPNDIKFWMYEYNTNDIFFQNKTENNLSYSYKNANPILAGYSVTNSVAHGNYILQSNNDVEFISNKSVTLEPGFRCDYGNAFLAQIGRFNTCDQYPMGLKLPSSPAKDSSDIYTEVGTAELNKRTDDMGFKINIFPNPVIDLVTIVLDDNLLEANIDLISLDGKKLTKAKYIKNESRSISINMKSLSPGVYNLIVNSAVGARIAKITKL